MARPAISILFSGRRDPVWGKIADWSVRQELLNSDVPFLRAQLLNSGIEYLLLNGSSVMHQLKKAFGLVYAKEDPIHRNNGSTTKICSGVLFEKIRVFGWSTNIQSSFGVSNELKTKIGIRIAEMIAQIECDLTITAQSSCRRNRLVQKTKL